VLDLLEEELGAYFAGTLRGFSVLVKPAGTEFQRGVWAELLKIPYGETVSYGKVARRIGRPTASRAVGAANGANPVAILVPCHRVVDSKGGLHGYAGGLERKRRLLEVEGVVTSDGLGSGGLFTLSS
jgi:methylated-DNA-[protein]-cysteine S-methyltransferase